MRHLEQIMKDKTENDAALAKATKRAGELKVELAQLFNAVREAAGFNEPVHTSGLAQQIEAVESGNITPR